MTIDASLEDVTSGYNLAVINANFVKIQDALNKALNREGGSGNSMSADLDFNGNDILNAATLNGVLVADILSKATTFAVGTVTTGAAGSSVVVTNTGTSQDVVLNFTIPVGDTGAQGPAGSDGADGAGLVAGGTLGQQLVKNSGTDYDASWFDVPNTNFPELNGADPSDITDDKAAITASFGEPVVFSQGTYTIVPTTATTVTSDTTLIGNLGALIKFDSSTTTAKTDFLFNQDGAKLEGLEIEHDGPDSETSFIFSLKASDLRFTGLTVSGGNTSGNNVIQGIEFDDENVDNVRVNYNEFANLQRMFIRTNTATGDLQNFWFQGNYVHDLGQGGAQFNFPLGSISGVAVIDNYFDTFHAGTERIFSGGASVKQAIFSRNIYKGLANECLHLEENAQDVIASNNLFTSSADASNNGHGMTATDNNVVGSFETPTRLIVNSNVFHNLGTKQSSNGFRAPNDGTGDESATDAIITNNIFKNYDIGLNLDLGDYIVAHNIIEDCNTGCRMTSAFHNLEDNIFKNCTTAIAVPARGGMIGKNTFINCTTIADTTNNEKVSMTGFKTKSDTAVNLAIGSNDVDIGIDVGSEFYGTARVMVYIGTTAYQHRISTLEYDGTTVTDTELQRNGSGSVSFTGFVNNAGEIAMRLNNLTGGAIDLVSYTIDFDGIWISAS